MTETLIAQDVAKVLILEDEPAQMRTLTAIFQDEGFEVVGCPTCAEALAAMEANDITVAIIDLCLPDLGTLDLLRILEPWSERVPIIVNTAYGSYESAKEALNLGAFAYVEKAGRTELLVREVHRALQKRLKQYAAELEEAVAERTDDLEQANKQLKALASELTLTEERLKRTVATELHDRISQSLAVAKMSLLSFQDSIHDPSLRHPLASIAEMLSEALKETRSLTSSLSYPALNVLGLTRAIELWLLDEIEKKHGLRTSFVGEGLDVSLDDDVKAVLFRSVREALNNVIKHAQAQSVTVSVTRNHRDVIVSVVDDGIGFDPQILMTKVSSFGILSVQESLDRLGGQFLIEADPGSGCKVTLTAPLATKE